MSDSPGETIKGLLQWGTDTLTNGSGSLTPRLDAEVLLAHVLNKSRTWLYSHQTDALPTPQPAARYDHLIKRRCAGEPVSYLTGECEFWSLPLTVTQAVLTPRSDTERLVEVVLDYLEHYPRATVLDAGTGSGAIGVALAVTRPDLAITATDISPEALAVATLNFDRHRCGNITPLLCDWFTGIEQQQFQVIVSNPPYIPENDPHLTGDGVCHEPSLALTSGSDGLDDIRHIIDRSADFLTSSGALYLEHGYNQADSVAMLLINAGFKDIQHYSDLAGVSRVTRGIHRE